MIKRAFLCVFMVFVLLGVCSCNDSKNENETISTDVPTYNITLKCPEDATIDGTSVEVSWRKSYKLPKPSREHYVFNGWQYQDKIIDASGLWTLSGDIELTACWALKNYAINYQMYPHYSERISSFNIETESFELMTPAIVEGKMFLGWTSEGIAVPTKCIPIKKGSFGNRTYIAHWISVDEIENQKDDFVFEIVDDHAVVIGYCGTKKDVLTIPRDYNGYPVTTIGNSAFYGLGVFAETMLYIPHTITVIEDNAIGACDGLPMKIVGQDAQTWLQNATIGENNGGLSK